VKFLISGSLELSELTEKSQESWDTTFGKESWNGLGSQWGGTVVDQLERLEILKAEREKYIDWCNLANQILNDEKKLTLDKLEGLAQQSRCFPNKAVAFLQSATWFKKSVDTQ